MSDLITSQLVEASTQCRRKALFIIRGTPKPDRHEYEMIMEQRTSENRLRFLDSARKGGSTNSPGRSRLEICSNGFVDATGFQAACDAISQPRHARKKAIVHSSRTSSSVLILSQTNSVCA